MNVSPAASVETSKRNPVLAVLPGLALTRVAMMAPVIMLLGEIYARFGLAGDRARGKPPFPWFLIGFFALAFISLLVLALLKLAL